uniref:Uncharacterized protein n=1 Tax=Nonomuraea gerenzanensis TaxID=93944 RepID=A0A1M4EFR0_9ACTN|nr:hypothetical protein BN4615_P7062 [Nonomuraea gerenzanensis]
MPGPPKASTSEPIFLPAAGGRIKLDFICLPPASYGPVDLQ